MARRIRIVVGEGRTAQQGLLRFVLEGEGFDIVGEARAAADLSGVIGEQRPDVVVLDDGIGVMAVSMVHEVAPQAKIVLVWPSAVVPIGGDARVEPARILRDLGPAVEHVAAVSAGAGAALTEGFEKPGWIDRVRKDPATLRDKLEGTKETAKRPSVTELQRRGQRLHPAERKRTSEESERSDDGVPAPVVVLPVGAAGAVSDPLVDLSGGSSTAGAEPPQERSEWNRRLGSLALSGAAAVSALVLALALGGGRIPVSIVRGGGRLPPGVPGFVSGPTQTGPSGAGSLGGSGYNPFVPEEPSGPARGGNGGVGGFVGEVGGGGLGGNLAAPGGPGAPEPSPTTVAPGGGNPGGGTPGGGNPGSGGGGGGGDGNGGGGGTTDGGTKGVDEGMPGKSAEHNPHGGPPSKLGMTPAHGKGLGANLDKSGNGKHASKDKAKHSHKH
jgi:hypothetical protein